MAAFTAAAQSVRQAHIRIEELRAASDETYHRFATDLVQSAQCDAELAQVFKQGHVRTDMYHQTCTNGHLPTDIYQRTCTIRHAPTHMYHETCTNGYVP